MNARILLLLPIVGCYTGAQDLCPQHCWGFTQPVTGVMGEFDGECKHRNTMAMFAPDLPAPAEFHGRLCLATQAEHDAVKRVIEAVNCGTSMACWGNVVIPDDVDTYEALVSGTMFGGGIGIEARNACMDHLFTQGCQTDPEEDGHEHALALCNDFVLEPAVAAMTDLTGCDDWDPPREEQGAYKPTDPYDCDFSPDLATTGNDDGPVCDEGEEGEEGDGADDESGAPLLDDPWGDLEALVDCGQPTVCDIDPELLANVTESFQIFYDEEVWLEMVTITGLGTGAQITGVDSSEDVEELLDAFGIEDEDVITHVNGIHLQDEEDALEALHAIPLASSWTITVRRWNGSSWGTLTYSISVVQ